MKKQKNQLIILGILLVVIIAAYLGMKFYNKNHSEDETDVTTYPITQADKAAVTEFTFTNENGTFSFQKEEDTWYYTEDRAFQVDTVSLEDMIISAVSMTSEDKMDNVTDLSQYGLDKPVMNVSFKTESETVTIHIGDYNSTISKYYAYVEGTNTVYTIDSTIQSTFTKTPEDLKVIETESTETAGSEDASESASEPAP